MTDTDDDTVFVIENFDGDVFQQLRRGRCRILGPPVIIKCARGGEVCLLDVLDLPVCLSHSLSDKLIYMKLNYFKLL